MFLDAKSCDLCQFSTMLFNHIHALPFFYNWFIQNSISYLPSTQLCFFKSVYFLLLSQNKRYISFRSLFTHSILFWLISYVVFSWITNVSVVFSFSSIRHEKRFLSSCYMLSMQTFISKISHDFKTSFKWISIGFNQLR